MGLEDLKIGVLRSEKKIGRRCGRRDFVVEDWGWDGIFGCFTFYHGSLSQSEGPVF